MKALNISDLAFMELYVDRKMQKHKHFRENH